MNKREFGWKRWSELDSCESDSSGPRWFLDNFLQYISMFLNKYVLKPIGLLVKYSENIAIANKEFGINVSVLCPQAVKTNMTKGREQDVASIDGMLEPDEVAKEVILGIKEKKFNLRVTNCYS